MDTIELKKIITSLLAEHADNNSTVVMSSIQADRPRTAIHQAHNAYGYSHSFSQKCLRVIQHNQPLCSYLSELSPASQNTCSTRPCEVCAHTHTHTHEDVTQEQYIKSHPSGAFSISSHSYTAINQMDGKHTDFPVT